MVGNGDDLGSGMAWEFFTSSHERIPVLVTWLGYGPAWHYSMRGYLAETGSWSA